jgi:hypothetical protein
MSMEGKKKQASRRKYHYIYKTTCLITNRYYIGMHSTDNLEDGYQGSGKRLWRSINKYGRENHKTEILEFLPNREQLKQRESKIVNEELISDSMCMNLKNGGQGGLVNKEHGLRLAKAGTLKLKELFANKESEWYKNYIEGRKEWAKLHNQTKWGLGNKSFTNRNHTAETKAKISKSMQGKQLGNKNSQFGTCWIHNSETKQCIKIKNTEIDSYLSNGWTKGRKMKF